MRRNLLLVGLLVLAVVLFCFWDREACAVLVERAKNAMANTREFLFPDNLERLRRGTVTVEELEQGRVVAKPTNAVASPGQGRLQSQSKTRSNE